MGAIKERIVANGHGALSPSYFCVHSTANPGATAANHATYWSNNPDNAVHLVSDWKECLHTVPYDRLCWQVGNGNAYVEGIEICEATNRSDFEKGIKIAADAVRERLKARGWSTSRLITHHQATQRWGGSDHTDPDPYFKKWGYAWSSFVKLVKEGSEDMEPKDVWNYNLGSEGKSGYNNTPAWKHLSYAHWDTARLYKILGQTEDVAAGDGEKKYSGNIYTRVCYIDKRIREMYTSMSAMQAAIEALAKVQGADAEEIAAIVADAVKEKLEAIDLSVTVED